MEIGARELLGNNIAYYRLKKNWSQEDLAEKLGTNSIYISYLENAKKNTKIDYVEKIANVLEIDIKDLFEIRGTNSDKKRRVKRNECERNCCK